MNVVYGDIWSFMESQDAICIPTNIGWKTNGENVMGRGVAQQAAKRFPELPAIFGKICKLHSASTTTSLVYIDEQRLIMFPTKALNREQPWLSWNNPSDVATIEHSLQSLVELCDSPGSDLDFKNSHIYLPLVGCGNGGLFPDAVTPLLYKYLTNEKFVLVRLSTEA